MRRTFVIGDVHGRLENLVALLAKAGITPGDGTRIIQLGDLGDFRKSTVEADMSCYWFAHVNQIEVLWGNHDWATRDWGSTFQGYSEPPPLLRNLIDQVNPKFAAEAHGFLLTHAGVHPDFVGPLGISAKLINNLPTTEEIITDIGPYRGGNAPSGGILWRDDREALADIPQVFGHTRGYVRSYGNRRFCIDVGARKNGNLAGMWLPDMKVVSVGEDADINEMAVNGESL